MTDFPRLIEHAFPLKQASLDSVHEKNVRHGHISTLHIWPARRPLAASRAALIATLLPDPGTPEKRRELCEKIGGKVVKKIERKKMPNGQTVDRVKEETEGGILHWGRETTNADTLEWFRQEIRKAYGGRAPKVLDPFAGGGAIPLEAMRLGCEATAVDINPVAWFILKCTLDYPQKLAGQKRPLPDFILKDKTFMEAFFKSKGMSKAEIGSALRHIGHEAEAGLFNVAGDTATATDKPKASGKKKGKSFDAPASSSSGDLISADLAWHVRAWGQWVLARARKQLAELYPTYADFEPIKPGTVAYEKQPMRLVPTNADGVADVSVFNREFSEDYLGKKANPRWIAKPTVAYLWARTVTCKNCRSQLPLLKTRWLCKKDRKRVLLTMHCADIDAAEPDTLDQARAKLAKKLASPATAAVVENPSGLKRVVFGIQTNVPVSGSNAAQKREHDKRIAAGTMSRAGAKCPCCPAIMTMEDIRVEGKAGRLGVVMTAIAVDGPQGKQFRQPTEKELAVSIPTEERIRQSFDDVPFGTPDEPTPKGGGSGAGRAFSVQGYGIMRWRDLFNARQLTALGTLVAATRAARQAIPAASYPSGWVEAIGAYLACGVDRLVDFANVNTQWKVDADTINHALVRFAIQITWDFAEGNPLGMSAGAYHLCINRIATGLDTLAQLPTQMEAPSVISESAMDAKEPVDLVLTDPPYYDAIPYSDLMDWFYVFLRRMVFDLTPSHQRVMESPLGPKWDSEKKDGELIDDCSRHDGDAARSKQAYEDGMAQVFSRCAEAMADGGRLVIVFANKSPDAWETLVSSVIRAGFVVDGSWPIQTEQPSRTRGISSAALASSVWLVCKRRSPGTRPGWDAGVLEEMRSNIATKLQAFWDAGIRGPDFIWAATGPALEAYSKHPAVKKADQQGQLMTVGEFLQHVRRLVIDYVVGKVLSGEETGAAQASAADRLDEPTAYYLLHRHDFGLEDAPVGACILYAVSCGLSDSDLVQTWDILARTGAAAADANDNADDNAGDDADGDGEAGTDETGGKVRLKAWSQRRNRAMGHEAPTGKAIPLIDRIHRLLHLWKAGDVQKVDEYLDVNVLRRHELFKRLLQSLIEISRRENQRDELQLLESLSNHIGIRGVKADANQLKMYAEASNSGEPK